MDMSLLDFLYLLADTCNTAFQTLLDLPLWLYVLLFLLAVAFKLFVDYYDGKK